MKRRSLILASMAAVASSRAIASPGGIELVYIGGRDCPWCRLWTRQDKPKLLASPLYRKLRYVEIETARLRDSYNARYWPAHLVPILHYLPVKDGTPRFLIVKDGRLLSNDLGEWETALQRLKQLTGTA